MRLSLKTSLSYALQQLLHRICKFKNFVKQEIIKKSFCEHWSRRIVDMIHFLRILMIIQSHKMWNQVQIHVIDLSNTGF